MGLELGWDLWLDGSSISHTNQNVNKSCTLKQDLYLMGFGISPLRKNCVLKLEHVNTCALGLELSLVGIAWLFLLLLGNSAGPLAIHIYITVSFEDFVI